MNDRDKLILSITNHITNEALAKFVNDKVDCDDCPFNTECRSLKIITYGMCESYVLSRLNKGKK